MTLTNESTISIRSATDLVFHVLTESHWLEDELHSAGFIKWIRLISFSPFDYDSIQGLVAPRTKMVNEDLLDSVKCFRYFVLVARGFKPVGCAEFAPPPARPLSHKTDFIRHESKRWPLMIYSARFITAAPWPSKLGRTRLHSAKNESYSRWVFCLVFVVCLVWFGLVWFFFISPAEFRRLDAAGPPSLWWRGFTGLRRANSPRPK